MATITVTNLNDNGNGSLRQAITNAGPGDTINFAANLAGGTLTLTSGALDITSNVIIEGDIDGNGTPDITISGGGSSGVFDVVGGTSTLDGLVLTGGQAVYGGGVYIDSGASLTVKDSTLQGNNASSLGGGIYARSGAALTVMNSTVSGNTATNDGGGIEAGGTVTLVNSTVSDNSALRGAGIAASTASTTTVTNSTISGNTATNGGGIYAASGATLTLYNSVLALDSATSGEGGGILNDGALTLVNSTLSSDSAYFGGGVFNEGGTAVLTNSSCRATARPRTARAAAFSAVLAPSR